LPETENTIDMTEMEVFSGPASYVTIQTFRDHLPEIFAELEGANSRLNKEQRRNLLKGSARNEL
jgi:hypothetical protein